MASKLLQQKPEQMAVRCKAHQTEHEFSLFVFAAKAQVQLFFLMWSMGIYNVLGLHLAWAVKHYTIVLSIGVYIL